MTSQDRTIVVRLQQWFLDATSALRATLARLLHAGEMQIGATAKVADELTRDCASLRAGTAAGSRWATMVALKHRELRDEETRLTAETQSVAVSFSGFAAQAGAHARQVAEEAAAATPIIGGATTANGGLERSRRAVAAGADDIAAAAQAARQLTQRLAAMRRRQEAS